MPRFDLTSAELHDYRPDVAEPADFDAFWASTLAEHLPAAEPVLIPVEGPLRLVEAYDVTFAGFDGHPIKGWLMLPKDAPGPLPGVVSYVGYGGGRGLPHEHLAWAASGYASACLFSTRWFGSSSPPSRTR